MCSRRSNRPSRCANYVGHKVNTDGHIGHIARVRSVACVSRGQPVRMCVVVRAKVSPLKMILVDHDWILSPVEDPRINCLACVSSQQFPLFSRVFAVRAISIIQNHNINELNFIFIIIITQCRPQASAEFAPRSVRCVRRAREASDGNEPIVVTSLRNNNLVSSQ